MRGTTGDQEWDKAVVAQLERDARRLATTSGCEDAGGCRIAPVGVLAGHEKSAHQAALLPDWGPTILFTQGGAAPDGVAHGGDFSAAPAPLVGRAVEEVAAVEAPLHLADLAARVVAVATTRILFPMTGILVLGAVASVVVPVGADGRVRPAGQLVSPLGPVREHESSLRGQVFGALRRRACTRVGVVSSSAAAA